MVRCPICEKEVLPRPENASFPFCCARCKTIDLGKWMSEEYRIAGRDTERDGEEAGEDEGTSNSNEDVRH